jgi:2'-5' RNA ligase
MNKTRYGLHVLLPEALDRRFAKWAKATPGASWPDWGGHITLLAAFTSLVPEVELMATIGAVTAQVHAIDVHLTHLAVAQDLTREGYKAVFLTPPAETRSGLVRLTTLQAKLERALRPLRIDQFPDLARRDFLPHITLALGLSEHEAHQLVSTARAVGLVAEFDVEQIWLICIDNAGGAPAASRHIPIKLNSPPPSGP